MKLNSLDEKTFDSLYKTFKKKNKDISYFFIKLEVLSEFRSLILKELLKDLEYLTELHEGGRVYVKRDDVVKMLKGKLE